MSGIGAFITRVQIDATVFIVDRYTGDVAALSMSDYAALPEDRYAAVNVYSSLNAALDARRIVLAQRRHGR